MGLWPGWVSGVVVYGVGRVSTVRHEENEQHIIHLYLQDRTGYTHCAAHKAPTPTCCSTYSARRHTLGHSPPPPRDKIAPFHPINGVGGGGDGVRGGEKV